MRTRPTHAACGCAPTFRSAAFAAALPLLLASPAFAAPRQPPGPGTLDYDFSRRVNANQISMVVTNWGHFAFDVANGASGLEFPKGTGKTAVFASGLWLGGMVNGQLRVALAEYSSEFVPGSAQGGFPEWPYQPDLKVYELRRVYADAATRDAAIADYQAGAVPRGASPVAVLADGSLDIRADQLLWAVYNDLDSTAHTNSAGGTSPLGVEVQQTTYAFDRPDALGRSVFLSFKIVHRGVVPIQDLVLALWSDPDLGGAADDLVGSDPGRSLGYCYNATNADAIYGASPPAVGYDLLRVTRLPSGAALPATAFVKYVNGTDPANPFETYHYLQGLDAAGAPIVDPTTGQATTFMHAGDPIAGTGWLDTQPSDRRFVLCSGPYDLLPGEALVLDAAIVIGQGPDRLGSLAALMDDDAQVQDEFDRGFAGCDVAMGFDFTPTTLNLRSMGRWVNGFLEPPAPYETSDIDVASIRLNGVVAVDPAAPTATGDHDGDGRPDLMVKFDRGEVQATLPQGNAVPILVTGMIADQCFEGGTLARTLHAPVTAPAAGAVITPGLAAPIRWETPAGVEPLWVAVLSSMDDGENWHLEARNLPNYGTYAWSVPYATSEHARVAVVLVEHAEETGDLVEGVVGMGPSFRIGGTTGVDPGPPTLELLGSVPHPARGSWRLVIRLPDASPATLAVHDLSGRRLWSRDLAGLGAGLHAVAIGDRALAPGVYWVRLRHGAEERSSRVVLLE